MADISELIQLAKLFKHGFVVRIRDGELWGTHHIHYSYSAFKPLITVTNGRPIYHNSKIPDNCVIVGYLAKDNNYFIGVA